MLYLIFNENPYNAITILIIFLTDTCTYTLYDTGIMFLCQTCNSFGHPENYGRLSNWRPKFFMTVYPSWLRAPLALMVASYDVA